MICDSFAGTGFCLDVDANSLSVKYKEVKHNKLRYANIPVG